jgi:hypothetical protein
MKNVNTFSFMIVTILHALTYKAICCSIDEYIFPEISDDRTIAHRPL